MKRITIFLTTILLLAGTLSVQALTISPQLQAKLIREGAWPAFAEKFRQWQAQLAESDQSLPPLSKLGSIQEPGGVQTMKVVVILVDFSDEPAQTGLGPVFFDTLLFGRYDAVPRTFKDFYLENSYDKLLIDGDVFGWFRMPHPYSYYYGTGNGLQTQPNAQTLALDAAVAADPTVNFSAYANVAHGLDGFIVIHAGPGAEEGGQTNMIWSHHWTLPGSGYTSGDGTTIRKYVMGPEMEFGGPTRIGVYCHEFGHELGLPDLYDVGSGGLSGLGDWSLMASGSWNGNGQWPAHLDGWSKLFLNFGDYEMVNSNLANVTLGSTITDSLRYKILLPAASFKEYFVVENRQKTGFDRMLPGAGLLIYHCDDNLSFCSQGSNDVEACGHWHVSVEQADGRFDLENNAQNQGDSGDPFPGPSGLQTEFTNLTTPSTASWYGNSNQVSIWGIKQNSNGTVTCNLEVDFSRVNIQLMSNTFDDATFGNGDGIFMPGERTQLFYSIKNLWTNVTGVTVAVSSPTAGITFNNSQNTPGNLITSQSWSNTAVPIDFNISPTIQPVNARFDLTIKTTNPADTIVIPFYKYVGGVQLLLVDDDGGTSFGVPAHWEAIYKAALDSLAIPYNYWDIGQSGVPGDSQKAYKYILWFTGDDHDNILPAAQVAFLKSYLDQGGSLLITGQGFGSQLAGSADSTFLRDYLHARITGVNSNPRRILGRPDDPVSMGDSCYSYGGDGASNQFTSSVLQSLPGATNSFSYAPTGGTAVNSYADHSGFRVVYFGFGIEAIDNTNAGYAKRQTVIQRALDFLGSNTATDVKDDFTNFTIPAAFELSQNFPNPFNPSTVIHYIISAKSNGKPYTLDVYNLLGEKVATLAYGVARAGSYTAEFDASDKPSGIYLYRLSVGSESVSRKMVLIK